MDPLILGMIAVVIGLIGFLLGFGLRALMHRRKPAKKSRESQKTTKAKKPPKRNWSEVAHLWRDERDKRLVFQIGNQYYKRGDELTRREQQILLNVVMDFYRWLEPSSPTQTRSETPVRSPGTSVDSDISQGAYPSTIYQGGSQDILAEPEPEIQEPPSVIGSVLSASISAPEPPRPSMVNQVDSILQEKLQDAQMQKWAVRLIESPNQGMVVMVGMERYESIDDVPYARVRDIIRAAVADWEQRAESGNAG